MPGITAEMAGKSEVGPLLFIIFLKMRKKLILAGLVLVVNLIFIGYGWIAAPALAPKVLPPSIMPVVILSGSDYEMGYQYGEQVGQYIEARKDAEWILQLKKRSSDEVLFGLKKVEYYISKYAPEQIEQMKGIAEGATAAGHEVSYADILLLNALLPSPTSAIYPPGAGGSEPSPKACSNFTAWGSTTTDGSLICSDSFDGIFTHQLVIVAFPDEGNNYITALAAGQLSNHFIINNKGLFSGNSGGGKSGRDIDYNYGISWTCALQHIARFADTAFEAKEMLLAWQIDTVENYHFVDVNGGAFIVEKTAAIQSVREPGDFGETDFLYATNNYFNDEMRMTKEFEVFIEHGGFGIFAVPRNLFLWDMLHNYQGKVDLEFAKMMWRFPRNPAPYLFERGLDPVICRPINRWIGVLAPDDGDGGVAYISTGPVGLPIQSSATSKQEIIQLAYPPIDVTHTFYELTLAKDPATVVGAAKDAARVDIATAYSGLVTLRDTDTRYTALNEIYSEANVEYCEGNSFYEAGLLASGNQALSYFAQAATAFTRSQAHALQVYEALVSPATSPSDLGLRPFGGVWEKWESKVKAAR